MRLALVMLCDIPYLQPPQGGKPSQPVRPGLAYHLLSSSFSATLPLQRPCLVTVRAVVAVLFREEELLDNEVSGECYCRDAEAGERALEAVEPGEGSCVSPLLAVQL